MNVKVTGILMIGHQFYLPKASVLIMGQGQ